MSDRTTGRESTQFMLRLPDGMRERIAARAKATGRSMNAEIVQALMDTFPPDPSLDEMLGDLEMYLSMAIENDSRSALRKVKERMEDLKRHLASQRGDIEESN